MLWGATEASGIAVMIQYSRISFTNTGGPLTKMRILEPPKICSHYRKITLQVLFIDEKGTLEKDALQRNSRYRRTL